jgi:hypothetical protein
LRILEPCRERSRRAGRGPIVKQFAAVQLIVIYRNRLSLAEVYSSWVGKFTKGRRLQRALSRGVGSCVVVICRLGRNRKGSG